ncbi:hypothetical protein [Prescottella subtropica]|uniref:hypothetical protein n=1 Tax=Prescottella subtropica TaxID=2545757 RepID=UPI0010F77CD7|nr:hypothetical protein [Prescottella subtropica]
MNVQVGESADSKGMWSERSAQIAMMCAGLVIVVPAVLLIVGLVVTTDRTSTTGRVENCEVLDIRKPGLFRAKELAKVATSCGILHTDRKGSIIDSLTIGDVYDFDLRINIVDKATTRIIARSTPRPTPADRQQQSEQGLQELQQQGQEVFPR